MQWSLFSADSNAAQSEKVIQGFRDQYSCEEPESRAGGGGGCRGDSSQEASLPAPHWAAGFELPLPGHSDLLALPWDPPISLLVNKAFIFQARGEKLQTFIIKCPGEGQLPKSGAGCPSGG